MTLVCWRCAARPRPDSKWEAFTVYDGQAFCKPHFEKALPGPIRVVETTDGVEYITSNE